MSISESVALEDCHNDASVDEQIATLVEAVQELQEINSQLQATVQEQSKKLSEQSDRIEELEAGPSVEWSSSNHEDISIESTDGTIYPLGKSISSKVSETDVEGRIDDVKGGIEQSDPTPNDDGNTLQKPQTPLEQTVALPQQVIENESANVQRAVFIASDITDYSQKVPAGRAIRSSDLRRILKAGCDCNGHTETVSRVMDVLDDLGGDDVKIVDRRGEKRIVFSQEAVSRLEELSQTDNDNHGAVMGESVGT